MGLFDMFKKPAAPAKPEDIKVESVPANIYAPVSGEAMNMEDVPDPVFASGALGEFEMVI